MKTAIASIEKNLEAIIYDAFWLTNGINIHSYATHKIFMYMIDMPISQTWYAHKYADKILVFFSTFFSLSFFF